MTDTDIHDDAELLESVYGVTRDEVCVHGHYDCAEYERGPCANETYARRLAARASAVRDPESWQAVAAEGRKWQ